MKVQNLARPGVDQRRVSSERGGSHAGKGSSFGVKFPEQAAAIVVGALPPGAVAAKQALLFPGCSQRDPPPDAGLQVAVYGFTQLADGRSLLPEACTNSFLSSESVALDSIIHRKGKRAPSAWMALFCCAVRDPYLAALAALMASISSGVTLNRSPQMP